ncbi:HD domain-containing protein [Bacillus timonensis]|nr:HD domain-containing protein [Bacillus timonensis]
MNSAEIIARTSEFVKSSLIDDSSGHDWWHIFRVHKIAKRIAIAESADLFIVEMAALLHDIADEKLNESEKAGLNKVRLWLNKMNINQLDQNDILNIITSISFKGGNQPPVNTLEAKIVQDADRLDAIGAIGIARTFAYAGSIGDLIYDPNVKVRSSMTKEEYRLGKSTAINHFYEKLLKLERTMNTTTGKKEAKKRHQFMETYLQQFFKEWNGFE